MDSGGEKILCNSLPEGQVSDAAEELANNNSKKNELRRLHSWCFRQTTVFAYSHFPSQNNIWFFISTWLICILALCFHPPKYSHFENFDEKMNVLGLALMFTICWKSGKWREIKRPPVLKLENWFPICLEFAVRPLPAEIHFLSLHLHVFIYDRRTLTSVTCTLPPNCKLWLRQLCACTPKAHSNDFRNVEIRETCPSPLPRCPNLIYTGWDLALGSLKTPRWLECAARVADHCLTNQRRPPISQHLFRTSNTLCNRLNHPI